METRDTARPNHSSLFKAFPPQPRAGLRDALGQPDAKVCHQPCPRFPTTTTRPFGAPPPELWGSRFSLGPFGVPQALLSLTASVPRPVLGSET